MEVPLSWLNQYLDPSIKSNELIQVLSKIGLEVKGLKQVGKNKVYKLEIKANRPDCLSVLGIAREIASFTKRKVVLPKLKVNKATSNKFDLDVQDKDLCPRYLCQEIKNVTIGKSPKWLADSLVEIGLRPINNLVDISNYVLFELGHPIHIFDLDLLEGDKVVVRRAKKGEQIVILDGREIELTPENLVIADAKKPVALAGIMGGDYSGVSNNTKNILVECAYFEPRNIRVSSANLGVNTDSSARFGKGIDVYNSPQAIERTIQLIKQIAGGKRIGGFTEYSAKRWPKERHVTASASEINDILGIELSLSESMKILDDMGLKCKKLKKDRFQVTVPSHRQDIEIEEDVAEELARNYGYDNIPETLPLNAFTPVKVNPETRLLRKIKHTLTALGFYESINYSFYSLEDEKMVLGDNTSKVVKITNPLSESFEVMRTSLLPSLMLTLCRNERQGVESLKIFELGKTYILDNKVKDTGVREEIVLALLISGIKTDKSWRSPQKEDFALYDLNDIVYTLLKELEIKDYLIKNDALPIFEPGISAKIMKGKTQLGSIGQVSNTVTGHYDCLPNTLYLELSFDKLLKFANLEKIYNDIPRFPPVERDLALVADKSISSQEIELIIRKIGGRLIERVNLFDIHEGKDIPEGKKSLAYSITIRSHKKTLSGDEVQKIVDELLKGLKKNLNVNLRT